MPSGWSFFNRQGSNVQIINNRLEVGQVDSSGGVYRPFNPTGVSKVQIDYDANIANVPSGQSNAAMLLKNPSNFEAGYAYAGAAKSGFGQNTMLFYSDLQNPGGPYSRIVSNTTHAVFGNYHISTTFQDGFVSLAVTPFGATTPIFSSGLVNAPGFQLSAMRDLALFGLTTTGASAWIDNAVITTTMIAPTCIAPQVLQNGACVTPPPTQLTSYTPNIPVPTSTPPISAFLAPSALFDNIATSATAMSTDMSPPTQAFNATQVSLLGAMGNAFKLNAQQTVNLFNEPVTGNAMTVISLAAGGPPADKTEATLAVLSFLFGTTIYGPNVTTTNILDKVPKWAKFTVDALPLLYQGAKVVTAITPKEKAAAAISLSVDATFFTTKNMVVPLISLIAHDPFDPNFKSVVSAAFPILPSAPSSGYPDLDAALSALNVSNSLAYGYLTALNISFDRYASAYESGDSISAALQMSAMLHYMTLVRDTLADIGVRWGNIRDYLQTGGFDQNVSTSAYLTQLQSLISSEGLPSEYTALLLSDGFSQSEINAALQEFLTASASGTSLDGLNDLARGAVLFGFAATSTVPEPGGLLLFMVATIALICVQRRSKTRLHR